MLRVNIRNRSWEVITLVKTRTIMELNQVNQLNQVAKLFLSAVNFGFLLVFVQFDTFFLLKCLFFLGQTTLIGANWWNTVQYDNEPAHHLNEYNINFDPEVYTQELSQTLNYQASQENRKNCYDIF